MYKSLEVEKQAYILIPIWATYGSRLAQRSPDKRYFWVGVPRTKDFFIPIPQHNQPSVRVNRYVIWRQWRYAEFQSIARRFPNARRNDDATTAGTAYCSLTYRGAAILSFSCA